MNDQKNDVVESKKNKKNDEMTSSQNDVDENRASSNNSSNECFFSEFFTQKKKRSRRSLRFNDASFLNRFLIQSRRLIFNEIRDNRRKHRSKKKNDRFSTKTKTSNCRLNVVVAQNFNEFSLFCLYDKIK
jgi:hypothetical protein